MTDYENETQAAIDAGREAQTLNSRVDIPDGYADIPIAIMKDGTVAVLHDVLRVHDARADRPRRRKGTAKLLELASFLEHVARNGLDSSVIFADGQQLTAVYNYNPPTTEAHQSSAAWGDHRAVYAAPLSDELVAWEDGQRIGFDQAGLASFFDERFEDLADYAGRKEQDIAPCSKLSLLGLCEGLELNTKGTFKAVRRKDGTKLVCSSEERGEGSTTIPERFAILVPVFDAGQSYPIEARLSLQIKDNEPRFSYKLLRLDGIKREAFAAAREEVAEKTKLPVFAGSPETQ